MGYAHTYCYSVPTMGMPILSNDKYNEKFHITLHFPAFKVFHFYCVSGYIIAQIYSTSQLNFAFFPLFTLIFALSPLFTLQKDKPYAILAKDY